MKGHVLYNKNSPSKKNQSSKKSLANCGFPMSMKEQKIKREQLKIDKLIEEISTEITKKLSFGIEEMNLKLSKEVNLQDLVKYILQKDSRTKNHIIILKYYLCKFPTLLETMNLSINNFENKDILNKIATHLKKEEIKKNHIVFYNGQIGKTFYIILEGEVSVLLPTEYNVEMTMEKYLDYLKYLYNLKDYGLLKLSYESNKNILERYEYEMNDELRRFDYGLDQILPNNLVKEEIDVESYINRFEYLNFAKKDEDEIMQLNINNKSEKTNSNDNNSDSNFDKNSNKLNDSSTSNNSTIQKNISNEIEEDKKYTKSRKKHNFSLWKYIEVIKLDKGKCFGELALQNVKNKRGATIISLTDCFFGTLEKDEYLLFVKETMEKIRRNNIERLLNTKLFQGITFKSFEAKLFNCFRFSKEKKGKYLFQRGEKRQFLTYIKKGEIQLEILATCKQLDNILLAIGGNPYDKNINNIIKDNKKINEFINTPKKFVISIFSQGDIIGMDELVYLSANEFNLDKNNFYSNNIILNSSNINLEENCYIFNAVFLTNCDIFKLDITFLKNMLKDKVIKENYDNMLKDKKERLIERLLNIKNNIILQYYNLINDNKKTINIEDNLNEKKNCSFLINKKKDVNYQQVLKNLHAINSQKLYSLNKIKTELNTRSNSFLEDKSQNKGKTKDFFYPELTRIQKRNNDINEFQKSSLLDSFINTKNFKIKLNKKKFLFENTNNSLHKFNSEKIMSIKSYYNSNINPVNKISLIKNNVNIRHSLTNFNNNTVMNNDDISKNNSSDKMSLYKSLYPNKKPKKLKLSDALLNSFKNPEIKMLKDQKIPKLFMNNALIYNAVIDKVLLRNKTKKNIFKNTMVLNNKVNNNTIDYNKIKYIENEKIFNSFDALAFDNIINNIKNNNIPNMKKFFPLFDFPQSKNKFNNQPLPRTTCNYFMKKSKKV